VATERLQKIIAAAGITSRRKAEELITQGRVAVNGQIVTELGSKADPERDHIKVDGKLLRGSERHVYVLLNKPKGYVTTVSDPEGRPTVMELIKNVGERIYPVGRLDYGSEGLLLMTNDGELANFLTRAASHVPKTYLVKIAGQASEDDINKLRHGMRIGSKPGERGSRPVHTAPAQVRIVREAENPWYEVTLIEGKNRQIRRMFEEIGHHVEKIKRVRYGPLELDVEPGEYRELTQQELTALRKSGRQPASAAPERSAAKTAVRFIGKARTKRPGREWSRPRSKQVRGHEPQPEAPKPESPGRADRDLRNRQRRSDESQSRFERNTRTFDADNRRGKSQGAAPPRRPARAEKRYGSRGPHSRFSH
jgi:23S rRNA pseudouridine2605 synthase